MEREETKDRVSITAGSDGTVAPTGLGALESEAAQLSPQWDLVADVVVIGSGAAGLPATLAALGAASVEAIVRATITIHASGTAKAPRSHAPHIENGVRSSSAATPRITVSSTAAAGETPP